LSDAKPYRLELKFALGNADVDLSGVSVERLHIHSGSSNVQLNYQSGYNKTEMDTLLIGVDLGSLQANHIVNTRSKVVVAEVGLGELRLDFSDQPLKHYEVYGSVGAGELTLTMPPANVPVIVNIKESWLCSITLPRTYRRTSTNAYVNSGWTPSAPNPIVFNLDVGMGTLVLKEKN
jgi:hypothetical protein